MRELGGGSAPVPQSPSGAAPELRRLSAIESHVTNLSIVDRFRYLLSGKTLVSEIPFPELSASTERHAGWSISVARHAVHRKRGALQGEFDLSPNWRFRLWKSTVGWLYDFDWAGRCWVDDHGSHWIWEPVRDIEPDLVRSILLGPVFALALHEGGSIALHASCVEVAGRAVAFIGPKGHGKSTLAMALTRSGAKLIADDLLPVDPRNATVRSAVQAARLFADSALELADGVQSHEEQGRKHRIHPATSALADGCPMPLSTVYFLAPSGPEADSVSRSRPSPSTALGWLGMNSAPRDVLLGPAAGERLQQFKRVLERCSVYQLHFPRDYGQLHQVVREIQRWARSDSVGHRRVEWSSAVANGSG